MTESDDVRGLLLDLFRSYASVQGGKIPVGICSDLTDAILSHPVLGPRLKGWQPKPYDAAIIEGKVHALLSGLKVGRMPNGEHFPSDVEALVRFGKWFATHWQPLPSPPEEK